MTAALLVDGISSFADRFEGFILDQWGVIHDGQQPYPAALETLSELNRRGKRVVLLSNSGRRASLNRRRLTSMGFEPDTFDAIITSGEAAWQLLKNRAGPPWSELGRRCLLFTVGDDLGVVEDLGLELVDDPDNADFLFATALEIPPQTLDDYRRIAVRAVELGLPLVCSNPDKIAPAGGGFAISPGTLAEIYSELGGVVHFVGKPHGPIYAASLEALSALQPSQIVAIGDSLEHDVTGAKTAGLAACFVTSGVHKSDFPPGASAAQRSRTVEELAAKHGVRPDWVIPRLSW
jgi:HAD superfamily hydrolase (TIGR01459 family)